jgi:hypothetical protein
MAKARPTTRGFETIDLVRLDTVTGGRIIPRSGQDPMLLKGISELTQVIAAISQQMNAKKEAGAQQMMQVMQQMMQKRGGKG